jgi:aryl-phospho-beta-D-glucosidase BglC (GH1 family)
MNRSLSFGIFFASILSLVLFSAAAFADESRSAAAAPGPTGVPASSLHLLSKCINIDDWFSQYSPPARYATRLGPSDFALMRSAGFTALRLTIEPRLLFDEADPSVPKPAILYVDRAVRLALDAGLGLVFDPIHGSSNDDAFERSLARDPAFGKKVEAFWESLARHYAAVSADRILFELMNEPHLSTRESLDASWWAMTQEKLAAAVRRGAPANTIVATGEKWGGVDGLLAIKPLADRNVVYSFHCYEPFTFTHQGAEWTDPLQKELAGIPYPSSPESVAPVLDGLPSKKARERVEAYGKQGWDAAKLRAFVGRAADWARANGTVVWCGEFGTYKKVAPAADRLRWIGDMRTALEGLGIGWSMWEYDSGFGLVSYRDARHHRGRVLDPGCLEALGLSVPGAAAEAASGSVPAADADPIAAFESGAASALDLPLEDLGSLWTRDSGAGELGFDAALAGDRIGSARVVHEGKRDWALSSTYSIDVGEGERYRLSSRASVSGEGKLSLEAVAYDRDGKVVSWSLGSVSSSRNGTEEELSAEFAIPRGVVRIEPRWSGQGPARAELRAMRLERLGAAARP